MSIKNDLRPSEATNTLQFNYPLKYSIFEKSKKQLWRDTFPNHIAIPNFATKNIILLTNIVLIINILIRNKNYRMSIKILV